jgi:hypothetical protein
VLDEIDGAAFWKIEWRKLSRIKGHPMAEALTLNDPSIVKEIEVQFAGYDEALRTNDIATLNRYFFDSPTTTRFGNAENLYGYGEISAYRTRAAAPTDARRDRTVITTYGPDFATVATLSRRANASKVGRTMQTWVRFPQGWRIVAAHVSTIDDPG